MPENQIIELLGGQEKYLEYKNIIIEALKRALNKSGIATQFDGTDIYEQYVIFTIQNWVSMNEVSINKVRELKDELKDKKFTPKEISDYIEEKRASETKWSLARKELSKVFAKFSDELTPDEEDNTVSISEEEAVTEMKKHLEAEISPIMYKYSLERLSDILRTTWINVTTKPIAFDINRRRIKSVLKGNTEFDISHSEQSEDEQYDFDVNAVQIVIFDVQNDLPNIKVYLPDKEYPEGTLRSTLILQGKEKKCEKELEALYKKYQEQGVDFSTVYKRVMAKERDNEQLSH